MVNNRNLTFFEEEVSKLDHWADDLKFGLEQSIKDTDQQIKEVRRNAKIAPTLEEKLALQKKQKGSRYICERLFWASKPKQSAKT